jgi:predicted metal-binding transcription factor (methanogenesis marker protein 9)
MTKPMIQIDDLVREMNEAEYAEYTEKLAREELELAQKAEKESAKAELLERLGITEAEAALLLG